MATTYNNLYLDARKELRQAGVEAAQLEARELLCYASEKTRNQFFRDRNLYVSDHVERRFRELMDRRLAGEPVAYIIGEWEFYGLTLDIYHTSGGNLAVVGDGRSHIAVMAGSPALSAPVAVDVLCAAGALSDSVQPAAILTTASSPRWLDQPGVQQVYYGQDIPFIQLRPGRSLQIKEAERVALQ